MDNLLEAAEMLQGLGAVSPELRNKVKSALAKSAMDRELAFLLANAEKLPVDTQNALRKGGLQRVDFEMYFRKEVTAVGGTMRMFEENDDREVGIRSISGGKLPTKTNVVLAKIGIAYGTSSDGSISDPENIEYGHIFDADAVPKAIQNGEVRVFTGTKKVYEGRLRKFFGIGADSFVTGVDSDSNMVRLNELKLLLEDDRIKIELELPNVALPGTPNHFVEVVLRGSAIGAAS